jgi:hypothetical protein
MQVDRSRRPEPAPWHGRPWTPGQSFAASFLFGAGACGTVAGINFARLGKRHYLLPAMLLGWVLFLAEAWAVLFVVPHAWARLAALLANAWLGVGFMLAQQPFFEAWKVRYGGPEKGGGRYKPKRGGQLLLVSLAALAVEVGAFRLLSSLGGAV